MQERDRLIASTRWLLGRESGRWAKVLRFAPAMQVISEPWGLGTQADVKMKFHGGLRPTRATACSDGSISIQGVPQASVEDFESLLASFASALEDNPFLRMLPFLMSLRPDSGSMADQVGNILPWRFTGDLAFRVDCICAGRPAPMSGEWDGRHLRVLAILDGDAWIPLTPQQA